ncbi:hypothetical protein ACO0KY_17830 [Undibacterium sp. Dicai25W]|uniref:hypothetical protein n=1 Tax=Undibacterium sp. Dicai25W TaxID=3413034 RepID=UPI003BF090E8
MEKTSKAAWYDAHTACGCLGALNVSARAILSPAYRSQRSRRPVTLPSSARPGRTMSLPPTVAQLPLGKGRAAFDEARTLDRRQGQATPL